MTESSAECCVCYEEGASVKVLDCNHHICLDCCGMLRETICPMCRRPISDELLEEWCIKRCPRSPSRPRRVDYKFDFHIPFAQYRRFGLDFFSVDSYPVGYSRDFEASVPPAALRSIIQTLNRAIVGSGQGLSLVSSRSPCLGKPMSFLCRLLVLRSIRQQNSAWAARGIACRLGLSPGWTLETCKLYVQWDPDAI